MLRRVPPRPSFCNAGSRAVLLVGIAGGIAQAQVTMGDVVVAKYVYAYEPALVGRPLCPAFACIPAVNLDSIR
jgi:nucleoside phosphorylase